MFGLLITIIIGFVVGVIAKLIMPGKEKTLKGGDWRPNKFISQTLR